MSADAPSLLWCGCPATPQNVVRDSNGVEVCRACTGEWALGKASETEPGRVSTWGVARFRLVVR